MRREVVLVGLMVAAGASQAANEQGIYPDYRDHYRYTYPEHWYSPGEVRLEAGYVYLDGPADEAESDGPIVRLNIQPVLSWIAYGRVGIELQMMKDQARRETEYGAGYIGLGLQETFGRYLNVAVEGGAAGATTLDDAVLFPGEDENADTGIYGRVVMRTKLRGPRDLFVEAAQVGEDTRFRATLDINGAESAGWTLSYSYGEKRGHDEQVVAIGYHWPGS